MDAAFRSTLALNGVGEHPRCPIHSPSWAERDWLQKDISLPSFFSSLFGFTIVFIGFLCRVTALCTLTRYVTFSEICISSWLNRDEHLEMTIYQSWIVVFAGHRWSLIAILSLRDSSGLRWVIVYLYWPFFITAYQTWAEGDWLTRNFLFRSFFQGHGYCIFCQVSMQPDRIVSGFTEKGVCDFFFGFHLVNKKKELKFRLASFRWDRARAERTWLVAIRQ